ncbi:Hypothetical predicted protein [Marmota monax]|uniref:Uncharacterized protein n=1 Tax=Marmota monax TaxID=9995 RepID=A0A5E4D9T5_MARMO|nr:hypothetical protein GHT09_015677 [Marmota monax]VTJ90818.1 Hypothetical predicted protein [Marmota monax]
MSGHLDRVLSARSMMAPLQPQSPLPLPSLPSPVLLSWSSAPCFHWLTGTSLWTLHPTAPPPQPLPGSANLPPISRDPSPLCPALVQLCGLLLQRLVNVKAPKPPLRRAKNRASPAGRGQHSLHPTGPGGPVPAAPPRPALTSQHALDALGHGSSLLGLPGVAVHRPSLCLPLPVPAELHRGRVGTSRPAGTGPPTVLLPALLRPALASVSPCLT